MALWVLEDLFACSGNRWACWVAAEAKLLALDLSKPLRAFCFGELLPCCNSQLGNRLLMPLGEGLRIFGERTTVLLIIKAVTVYARGRERPGEPPVAARLKFRLLWRDGGIQVVPTLGSTKGL